MTDLIDRTRPSDAGIAGEWTPSLREDVLSRVHAAPAAPRGRGWPIAIAACLALVLGLTVAGLGPWHNCRDAAALEPVIRNASRSQALEWSDGQFLHVRSHGKQTGDTNTERTDDIYLAPDGWRWAEYVGPGHRSQYIFPPFSGWMRPGYASLMPTDPALLDAFLRLRVTGFMSQDEAVFVAVGDMLKAEAAPPTVRAAAIGVLGRNPKVTVIRTNDPAGRPALRVDYRDEALRPGCSQSLYLAPDTGLLLAEADTGPGDIYQSVILVREVVGALPPELAKTLGTERRQVCISDGKRSHNDAPVSDPAAHDPVIVPSQSYSPTPHGEKSRR